MDRYTGKTLTEREHILQSIVDILTTPIGSRVMRREYGSRLFELIDNPINDTFYMQVYAAVFEALLKWEPRILPKEVRIENATPGVVELSLTATYNNKEVTFDSMRLAA